MTAYFMLISFMALLLPTVVLRSSAGDCKEKKLGQNIYLLIIAASFLIIMGLRAQEVGTDTAPYARSFAQINMFDSLGDAMSASQSGTPLYITLCWILGRFFDDPQILTFAQAAIIVVFLYKFIKSSSENYAFSAFLFFGLTIMLFGMNGSRQTMAMMISAYALSELSHDFKSKKAWLLVVCAVAIHLSSLVVVVGIVGIWLASRGIRPEKLVLIFAIIGFVSSSALNVATSVISGIFGHYTIYQVDSGVFSFVEADSNGRIVLVYLFLSCFLVLWLIKNRGQGFKDMPIVAFFLPMMAFGMALGIANAGNALTNRIVLYFTVPFICFIPTVVEQYASGTRILLTIATIVPLLVYDFLYIAEGQGGITPYNVFWS